MIYLALCSSVSILTRRSTDFSQAYIVQGHRFDILEQVGCFPALVNTIPTFFLVHMWPLILGLCSALFCGQFHPKSSQNPVSDPPAVLTLISFICRQAQLSQLMPANLTLTPSRYFRLMALACTELLCTTPLALFSITLNATAVPVAPWVSWEDTHYNFSRVGQIPAVLWRRSDLLVLAYGLTKWSSVLCAFVFFIFFGLGVEARKYYYGVFAKLLLVCHLKKPPASINEKSGCVNDRLSFFWFSFF